MGGASQLATLAAALAAESTGSGQYGVLQQLARQPLSDAWIQVLLGYRARSDLSNGMRAWAEYMFSQALMPLS